MTKDTSSTAAAGISGAHALIAQFAARGVRRIYGVPGGDCSLDIIAAAHEAGIAFILARTESAAAMMASAEAELTGSLGVLLTTRGPGLANGANGVACAMLDRCAMVVISDGYESDQTFVSHQRFDQQRMLEPVTKGSLRVDSAQALPAVGPLLDLALARPSGPVYLEVTGQGMRNRVPVASLPVAPRGPVSPLAHLPEAIAVVRDWMARARRPIIVAGLQTREPGAADGLNSLARQWQCPVFATYMGKGAMPDTDPQMMGMFMAGGAEEEAFQTADLILTYGLDPIELLPKPWRYSAAVLELSTHSFPRNHFTPVAALVGDLESAASQLSKGLRSAAWRAEELSALKAHMHARAAVQGSGITPTLLAQTACGMLPGGARITVDAGAHMLPVMAFFEAREPRDALISRGLATMAYALPTAIGAALAEPSRPVVAFTGDGGLMMCASELATAVQAGCKLTVVVFNDSAIAMIGVKQERRGLERRGMDYSPSDFALVAQGYGCAGFRVSEVAELGPTLQRAFDHGGPALVDVIVDPLTYPAQLLSLRG